MANTYTKLYAHNIFAVDFRQDLILECWEEKLYKYITGIVQGMGQKMIAINGISDHIHFLIGFKPTCALSDLFREVKKCSTVFIKENELAKHKFNWQDGFGSFTVSESDLARVSKYIMNQKEHHKAESFKNEYLKLLKENDIKYDEKYLFEWRQMDLQ